MLKNIVSTFSARFFIAVSNLAVAILISNFTGAAGRGEQSLIITLITFIIIISSMVGSASLSYLIPRLPFLSLIIPSYVWAALITVICVFCLPFTHLVPQPYMIHVSLLSFMLAMFNTNISVLIAKQRINASNLLAAIQSLVTITALVIFFAGLGKKTIASYIIALYCGYGISLLISFLFIKTYFDNRRLHLIPDLRDGFKQLALLGFYNQIAVFAQMLSFRLSYYILNSHHGSNEVGIYSNAVSIAESIWLIGRSIGTVQHSRIVNSNDLVKSAELTSKMNRLNLLFSILLLAVVSCIPSSWYQWIFGEEFIHINKMIWVLAPGIIFFGIALILGYYFSSTGKHYVNALASSAGLAVTIILGLILIPAYHSYGAGITASVSYGITALIVVLFFRRSA